jgi:hypothetical protein
MTRAAERPPKTDGDPQDLWNLEGEPPDIASRQALHLAHKAAEKFPELSERYRSYAGPAVIVSGALIALAGVAVARRLRRGQKPEDILNEITSEEIEQAAMVSSRQNRWWRMLARISRRRQKEANDSAAS